MRRGRDAWQYIIHVVHTVAAVAAMAAAQATDCTTAGRQQDHSLIKVYSDQSSYLGAWPTWKHDQADLCLEDGRKQRVRQQGLAAPGQAQQQCGGLKGRVVGGEEGVARSRSKEVSDEVGGEHRVDGGGQQRVARAGHDEVHDGARGLEGWGGRGRREGGGADAAGGEAYR